MPELNKNRTTVDRKYWSAEKLAAASKIEMLIEFWKIRPSELRAASQKTAQEQAEEVQSRAPLAPKYRHPVSGETWDGVGSQPEWLKHALLKEGLRPQDVRVADAEDHIETQQATEDSDAM
jgi:DNA-binding protein H-NS